MKPPLFSKTHSRSTAYSSHASFNHIYAMKIPISDTDSKLNACDISPDNCNLDMRDTLLPLSRIKKSAKTTYAKQNGQIVHFMDVSYNEDKVDLLGDAYPGDEENLTCTNQDSCTTDAGSLYYYAFYPSGIDYSNCKLPAIILFHAGGFSDCSGPNYEDSLCYCLARKGFIVFNVEYRRGRIKDTAEGGKYTSVQQMLAIYRAFQDGRGAIRSIIKRQNNIAYNNFPYQIDITKIFVAGQSAGATIAGSLAYYTDQAMIDSIFPVPAGMPSFSDALGPINADYYFGDTTIDYQSSIKGLWSMWGGFPMPTVGNSTVDEYKFLTRGYTKTLVPMIGFMGSKDPVFPYDSAHQLVYYPPKNDGKYVKETSCIINDSIKVFKYPNKTPNLRIECTNDIFTIFKNNGIPTLQYIDTSMGHGLTKPDTLGICPSDFGVAGSLTTNQVNEYFAARACFLFQSILKGKATLLGGVKKFINCEDFRHSPDVGGDCATKADNDNCN